MLEAIAATYFAVLGIWVATTFLAAVFFATFENDPEDTKWAFDLLIKGFIWPYYIIKILVKTFRFAFSKEEV